MMVETKGVQRERLGAAARLLACRYKAFEMIYLMYHLFAINSISFTYHAIYVLKLALLALSAGSALAVSGGACNKASQKNTGKGYWA